MSLNLVDAAKVAERCQRNWDLSKPVPQEDIDMITEVCTTMPTKQNNEFYMLVVIQDREIINEIFTHAYDPKRYKKTFDRQTQLKGSVLLGWLRDYKGQHNVEDPKYQTNDTNMAIGISSGSAALTAASLGYKTGFCKCFEADPVKDIFHRYGIDKKRYDPQLFLGIGHGKEGFPHNADINDDNEYVKMTLSYNKSIKVVQI